MTDLMLYSSEDGQARLHLRAEGQRAWLSQLEVAELFQATMQTVSLHAKSICEVGKLGQAATVKESLTVQVEGQRQVTRYNLDLIHADLDDLKEIEQLEHTLKNTGKKP